MNRLLLFDLDGTLLRPDKTISPANLQALDDCRRAGTGIGIATARYAGSAQAYARQVQPEVLVTSCGALAQVQGKTVYQDGFAPVEVQRVFACIRHICGVNTEMTVDTLQGHFWNYDRNQRPPDPAWAKSIWSDFRDFSLYALKICAQVPTDKQVKALQAALPDCDIRCFSGEENWHKITKSTATKANVLAPICAACGLTIDRITAFGDDFADLEMLRLAGTGVAMGNGVPAVQAAADVTIGPNDTDAIAAYLHTHILHAE